MNDVCFVQPDAHKVKLFQFVCFSSLLHVSAQTLGRRHRSAVFKGKAEHVKQRKKEIFEEAETLLTRSGAVRRSRQLDGSV